MLNTHDEQIDSHKMAHAAGNHKDMPDGVEMTNSFVVDKKHETNGIAGDANEHPPQRTNGYHTKQCWC